MLDSLKTIIASDAFQVFIKLVLSCFLAGIIGLERSSLSKTAGFGTHAIIGVSATLVVLCSTYMAQYFDIDAARIPAQILSGIGFIGAGTIIKNGINVKGVTTAAGIFSVTCIGLTVGVGFYTAAILATILVFLLLTYAHDISERFEILENKELLIVVKKDIKKALNEIEKYLKSNKIAITAIAREEIIKNEAIRLGISYDTRDIIISDILGDLINLESVVSVEIDKD
jgi:putative Mg2+ transporter-C (MgtC) family protein